MESKIKELWNAVKKTTEWDEFSKQIQHLIESSEYIQDYCEHSGTSSEGTGEQDIYLERIKRGIKQISINVSKIDEENL